MALEAGSRDDNINKSFYAFVDTNIRVGLSLTVHYLGQPRLESLPTQWVEVAYINGAAIEQSKRGINNTNSVWMQAFLNINCYEKLDTGLNRVSLFSLDTMATNVAEVFEIGTNIPILDYDTGGTPVAGGLMVFEKYSKQYLGIDESVGVHQVNISVPVRHFSLSA